MSTDPAIGLNLCDGLEAKREATHGQHDRADREKTAPSVLVATGRSCKTATTTYEGLEDFSAH